MEELYIVIPVTFTLKPIAMNSLNEVHSEQTIIGHGGIFNMPVDKGRVTSFTFDPLHHYLNHRDAPMV